MYYLAVLTQLDVLLRITSIILYEGRSHPSPLHQFIFTVFTLGVSEHCSVV